jgi:hypothetical protein
VFLSITEEEQSKEKRRNENHICLKYGKRVLHGKSHPELPRLEECLREELCNA